MSKRIFWLAGENSGDLHASLVLQELTKRQPDWQNYGIGGLGMQLYGFHSLFPFARFSVMGFWEVLKHISFFLKVEKSIRNSFLKNPPDLVVLVDYPGLNMRIAKMASNMKIPVLYFISPQFWAWKYNRIFKMKKNTNHVAFILPFEEKYFKKHGVKASYVGHPIAEEIKIKFDKKQFAEKHELDVNKTWLGFLPGSRDNEIKKMLPIYLQTIKDFDPEKHEFLISKANSVSDKIFSKILQNAKNPNPVIIDSDRYEMMKHCDLLVVTSGTATIETAFIGTPFIIVYKTSKISYQLGKRFIKIDRIGLPNIVLDKCVVPELIQSEVNAVNIAEKMKNILHSESEYKQIMDDLRKLHEILGSKSVSNEVSNIIEELLTGNSLEMIE
ncbi:MAG: lipid-A-disaccharide synthase [Candidatus Cloacimonadales bacterium]|nr:lipid-A-disaccharide synthase [Candidatus Cloacimonadales bacterium]